MPKPQTPSRLSLVASGLFLGGIISVVLALLAALFSFSTLVVAVLIGIGFVGVIIGMLITIVALMRAPISKKERNRAETIWDVLFAASYIFPWW